MSETWDGLVKSMKSAGYAWELKFDAGDFETQTTVTGWAWRELNGRSSGIVMTSLIYPVPALGHLYWQCQQKWPAPEKHPWDDLGLEALIAVCEERGWYPFVHKGQKINNGPDYWFASTGVGYPDDHFREPLHHRPDDALRDAMKRREQQEKQS